MKRIFSIITMALLCLALIGGPLSVLAEGDGTPYTICRVEGAYRIPLEFLRVFWPGYAFAGELRANAYKCGDMTANRHYLTWHPVQSEKPNFHRPEDFGRMTFD